MSFQFLRMAIKQLIDNIMNPEKEIISRFIKPAFNRLADIKSIKTKNGQSLIVKNSFPILWFGDLDKYLNSKLKILTLGLNPSNIEFENKSRFDFQNSLNPNDTDFYTYINALNEYFKKNPYRTWFDNFNYLLKVFDTSYGFNDDNESNTAIHIDAISPFATTQKISNLTASDLATIEANYDVKELISFLKPDIILASINRTAFEKAFGTPSLIKNASIDGDNRYKYIRLYKGGENFFVINGSCRNVPFGNIRNEVATKQIKVIFDEIKNQVL